MTGPLVVIACGAAKLDRPAPAADLYVGGQFRLALAAARQLAGDNDVRVLSAKHGLLRLRDVVAPYDLKMGQPGSIDARLLLWQAHDRGLLGRRVVALTPGRYTAMIRACWCQVSAPLDGLGIGCQRQVLAAIRDGRYSLGL